MPEESFEERTEAPTSKRRSEAREKGNVAKSTEINSVLVLLVGIILLRIFGRSMFREITGLFRYFYGMLGTTEFTVTTALAVTYRSFEVMARVVLPLLFGILFVGVGANVLQTGWLLTLKPLEPRLDKINPLAGLKRMFAMRALFELVKNLFKIAIIAWVSYVTIKGEFETMMALNGATIGAIWLFLLDMGFKIVLRIALVLIILAILDYAYQKYEYEKNLKMTRQEVKEERKQMEGDPKVKSRIRSLQLEMARRRMMQEVPRATVVVTNPTFIAIALRYEPGQMETPVVLAKGKRLIAERIKSIALENDIPIVEDKPLARTMYDRIRVGDEIPFEFFTAVAEILAYVYRLKNRNAA